MVCVAEDYSAACSAEDVAEWVYVDALGAEEIGFAV